jgi:ParB/RepB/Spo0J family partition protein
MSDHNDQPIANVQWLDRELLQANDYNPNHVASPELRLLTQSILESGWTQPIVARVVEDGRYEIVDGFHRWTVSGRKEISALTNGLVPVVVINPDPAHQRMATIRHNRARGKHHVVRMADIVDELVNVYDVSPEDLKTRLGMDSEEVERLLMRGQMIERGASEEFTPAWRPASDSQAATRSVPE